MFRFRTLVIAASMGIVATLYFNCAPAGNPAGSATILSSLRYIDTSASGVAAGAIGGAFRMHGDSPTCANDIFITNDADYDFSGSSWDGVLQLSTSNGSAVRCDNLSSLSSVILQSQFVDENGAPASGVLKASNGTIEVDHSVAEGSLFNFDNIDILPTIGNGFGTSISYGANHLATQVSVAEHIWAMSKTESTLYDYAVVGTADLSDDGTSKSIAHASVTVYDNVLQIIGTSTFTNVVYNGTCCAPVSGSISTTFKTGTNTQPTAAGASMVGKTETLEFNGCGWATLTNLQGEKSSIALSCF